MKDNVNGERESMTGTTTDGERSITVKRVIEASPERVYEAFLDPDDLVVWEPPEGFSAEVLELEPEEGGTFRIANNAQAEGLHSFTFCGTYQELKPGEKIVYTDESVVESTGEGEVGTGTVTFEAVPDGTEVTLQVDGIPEYVPLEKASKRWNDSLGKLEGQVED